MTEQVERKPRARIIRVESEFDPLPQGNCFFDGQPLVQKQIDYEFMEHGKLWRVPKVWASVCETDGKAFFAPEVGDSIDNRVFEITFPELSRIARLEARLQGNSTS